MDDEASTTAFAISDRFTVFWDIDWLGSEDKKAGIVHAGNLYMLNSAATGSLDCWIRRGGTFAPIPNTSVGIASSGKYYSKSGTSYNFTGTIGEDAPTGLLRVGCNSGKTVFTQMGLRQLLIFNKELSQAEVNDVLRVMFPA